MTAIRQDVVPASHGRLVRLAAGETLEVVNTRGTQVIDTWAFAVGDGAVEYMCMAHSRSVNSRLWPAVSEAFVSNRRRPMLRVMADTTPGDHDSLLCACNAPLYRELGCTAYHRSCEDNLHEELGKAGITLGFTPPPANLFMNVGVGAAMDVLRRSPSSRPGEHVALRAERDVLVVLSACPQDITPINSESRTPQDVALRILPA